MQDADGFWEPIYSFSVDGFGSPHRRYRRRVTPEVTPEPAPEAAALAEPDVGEGWRVLGADEILQAGDETDVGCDEAQWVPTQCVGQRVGVREDYYRRRVTPVPQAPQSRPAETRASSRQYVNEDNMKLRAENATLRSGVELLSAEATTLRSEVERLRLRPEERLAIERAQATLIVMCVSEEARSAADTMWKMLKRLGGGE
jgi:hypothetical protein